MTVELVAEEMSLQTQGGGKDPQEPSIEALNGGIIGLEFVREPGNSVRPDVGLEGISCLGRSVVGLVRPVERTVNKTLAQVRRCPLAAR